MRRFIEGEERTQVTLLPACLEDYVGEDNPVQQVVGVFVNELDLGALGFAGVDPRQRDDRRTTRRLLTLYIYEHLRLPQPHSV